MKTSSAAVTLTVILFHVFFTSLSSAQAQKIASPIIYSIKYKKDATAKVETVAYNSKAGLISFVRKQIAFYEEKIKNAQTLSDWKINPLKYKEAEAQLKAYTTLKEDFLHGIYTISQHLIECPNCSGTGKVYVVLTCEVCAGTGVISVHQEFHPVKSLL